MPPLSAKKQSITERRLDQLSQALTTLSTSTRDAQVCCNQIYNRSRQLDSLTSPASDASSMLSHANANLAATVLLLKDAREKFETVADVEPAIDRLHRGVKDWDDSLQGTKRRMGTRVVMTEQDVYSAADSMEVLRDTYEYFCLRPSWKSSPSTLAGLERVHQIGLDSMCRVVFLHLQQAGPAVKPQKGARSGAKAPSKETAAETRTRLASALDNRDLLKAIGEYEDHQPVDSRPIRELSAIFECLGSHGYNVQRANIKREPPGLRQIFGLSPQKVIRTEKVGSGGYCSFVKQKLETGFPQLDQYAAARQKVAFNSLETFYRKLKADRKRLVHTDEANSAARDAVRCLEHTMVIVAGEKNVFREVVAPTYKRRVEEFEDDEETRSPFYKKACIAAYSYIVATVVDRTLDIIETVFLKEGGIGQMSSANKSVSGSSTASGAGVLSVTSAGSACAAGLRMLDGVRMLGPSLAKICEMPVGDGETPPNSSLAAILCIAIHRTTVKNTSRTLENLSKAIQEDPLKGHLHRPKDASVSTVSSDVVQAIRVISPFVSAYKSVSKRRAMAWDPNMGEESGELDSFVRFLVGRLLNSLKGKALNYTKDGRDDSNAKSNLFMINNGFYLNEELGPKGLDDEDEDEEFYKITGTWFSDKINKIMDSEKAKYLEHWEALNSHLTAVGNDDLEYQKKDTSVLSLESGRLIKQRFSGFNEDFERTYTLHKKLCVVDNRLRLQLQGDVEEVFLPRYRRFYEKYTKIRFSKKKQEEYTKYSPSNIEDMLSELYTDPEPIPSAEN